MVSNQIDIFQLDGWNLLWKLFQELCPFIITTIGIALPLYFVINYSLIYEGPVDKTLWNALSAKKMFCICLFTI